MSAALCCVPSRALLLWVWRCGVWSRLCCCECGAAACGAGSPVVSVALRRVEPALLLWVWRCVVRRAGSAGAVHVGPEPGTVLGPLLHFGAPLWRSPEGGSCSLHPCSEAYEHIPCIWSHDSFNTQKTHLCETRAGTKSLSGHISKSVLPSAWGRVVSEGATFWGIPQASEYYREPKKKKKVRFWWLEFLDQCKPPGLGFQLPQTYPVKVYGRFWASTDIHSVLFQSQIAC